MATKRIPATKLTRIQARTRAIRGMGRMAMVAFCLSMGLILGVQSVIIAFGALKIGTRLTPSSRHRVANDYYLIGNLTSIILALIEFHLCKSQLLAGFVDYIFKLFNLA